MTTVREIEGGRTDEKVLAGEIQGKWSRPRCQGQIQEGIFFYESPVFYCRMKAVSPYIYSRVSIRSYTVERRKENELNEVSYSI
jgi:hypothetical protein